MAFWRAVPNPVLGRYVSAVNFSRDESPAECQAIQVLPDGGMDLLFSAPASACSGPVTGEVFGTKTRPLWIQANEPVENVAISFGPGGAARFLSLDVRELTDGCVRVAEVWGTDGIDLEARIGDARNLDERRRLLEEFLMHRAAELEEKDDLPGRVVESAVAAIRRRSGRITVAGMCGELGVGERKLERYFLRRVGVSPKTFARLTRFRAAHAALARGADGLTVVERLGYFDQAHLIKEMREFGECTPRMLRD